MERSSGRDEEFKTKDLVKNNMRQCDYSINYSELPINVVISQALLSALISKDERSHCNFVTNLHFEGKTIAVGYTATAVEMS